MNHVKRYDLVLAIYPSTRGFAFVLFEGPLSVADRGTRKARGKHKNSTCLRRIERLIDKYQPDCIVLQDMSTAGTWRAVRIRRLNSHIAELAEQHGIPVVAVSRAKVHAAFRYLGITTKRTIAETIAKHIPELAPHLPPVRKAWMSEDARMGLFDAAAMVLALRGGPSGQ